MQLTQKYLKECLDYNPLTGIFIWLERPREHFKNENASNACNARFSGKVAGTKHSAGYLIIVINRRVYRTHRLAFLWMAGTFPPEHTDHINHNRVDNRWFNLRAVTNQENLRNQAISPNNKSGYNGVSWAKKANKWLAGIKINGKTKHLGLFANINDAIECRKFANIKYGYHENHGG